MAKIKTATRTDTVTTAELYQATTTLDALLYAFEVSFMQVIEFGDCEREARNRCCAAFYGIRDLVERVVSNMTLLEMGSEDQIVENFDPWRGGASA